MKLQNYVGLGALTLALIGSCGTLYSKIDQQTYTSKYAGETAEQRSFTYWFDKQKGLKLGSDYVALNLFTWPSENSVCITYREVVSHPSKKSDLSFEVRSFEFLTTDDIMYPPDGIMYEIQDFCIKKRK